MHHLCDKIMLECSPKMFDLFLNGNVLPNKMLISCINSESLKKRVLNCKYNLPISVNSDSNVQPTKSKSTSL